MKRVQEVAVSILSANFLELKKVLDTILETNKIKRIHYDVMDYDFVNNLSFGPHILSNVANYTKDQIKIDCHMMVKVKNLTMVEYLKPFMESNIDIITFHYEALTSKQIMELINIKKSSNQKIGLAIKPNTPVKSILKYVKDFDLILIMSVEPGFGGQSFIQTSVDKITQLRNYIDTNQLKTLIQVDGGINHQSAPLCTDCDILVAGSYITSASNKVEMSKRVESIVREND